MRYAFVSDVRANIEALTVVLTQIECGFSFLVSRDK